MKGLWVILVLLWSSTLLGQTPAEQKDYPGPFPVKGPIFNAEGQQIAEAQVYPRFVEIHQIGKGKLGRVGVLPEEGWSKIFIMREKNELELVGHAFEGRIFNAQKEVVGRYFWTPTYSYAYDLDGKRVGSTKCIAWPR